MNNQSLKEKVANIIQKDPRYAPEAYVFIGKAVSSTIESLGKANAANKHITGKELIEGTIALAINEFGPLAYEVLSGWGIKDDISIGNIVFNMIEQNLLSKSEKDSIEDFNTGLDLKQTIEKYFQQSNNESKNYTDKDIKIDE